MYMYGFAYIKIAKDYGPFKNWKVPIMQEAGSNNWEVPITQEPDSNDLNTMIQISWSTLRL